MMRINRLTRLCTSAVRTRLSLRGPLWRSLQSSSSVLRLSSSSDSNQSKSQQTSKFALFGVFSLPALGGFLYDRRRASACGIVGFVGPDSAVDYLLEGMQILLNRGYDSTGISTLHVGSDSKISLRTTKFASRDTSSDSYDLLNAEAPDAHRGDTVGIGHSRWATHGAKVDRNSHPHCDWKDRVALVHNGTIENSKELKKELMGYGIPFSSDTDTEVIVQLIGYYLDQGMEIMDAFAKTLTRLQGTYGLAIIHKDSPGQIIAVRHGSPLIVGIGDGRMWVASEHSAFGRYTKQYVSLRDNEIAVITTDGISIKTEGRISQAPDEVIELSPDPYPTWTIKEIMEQPAAVSRALKYGSRLSGDHTVILGGLDSEKESLLAIKHLVLGACGTSKFASEYGTRLMRSLEAFDSVQTVDAAEFVYETFPRVDSGLLVVSQSGETRDVIRAVALAQDRDLFVFSVINAIGSLIARTTNCGVYVHAGREHAVASTKAFITQVTCLALIASWFAQNRGSTTARRAELISALHHLPTYTGMTLQCRDQCKEIAESLVDTEHIFVLGKGFGEPIAFEGALKIKEITYIHAEGYSGGALKHGPFALIEEGTPIIMLVLDDRHAQLMRTSCEEVRARGARVIAITDNPKLVEGIADTCIQIPSNGPLTALLGVIPLQLIAYELAILRGINPDKPKNLAKAVTTD
uniref:Glutamine--fructose-6-phosphate aminotransferase [isomerizing] n=1 Tax=Hirondellea gigas TaxID=1518452 RepID=A0A6A7G1D0_9CRUS